MTRLEKFMRAHAITPEALAKEACVTPEDLAEIVSGGAMPRLDIMTAMRVRDACGRLAGRQIGIAEVFDV